MNTMQRGILTLFCYDDKPNDIGWRMCCASACS